MGTQVHKRGKIKCCHRGIKVAKIH